jgi:hypothetical protein
MSTQQLAARQIFPLVGQDGFGRSAGQDIPTFEQRTPPHIELTFILSDILVEMKRGRPHDHGNGYGHRSIQDRGPA